VVIADCTQQRQQQEQGRLDRLKQQMTAGKLLAAIRESLDAALIQLNCPINAGGGPSAERRRQRQRGAGGGVARRRRGHGALQRCRPSLELESPPSGRFSPFLTTCTPSTAPASIDAAAG
jgi:hypothetical protein